MADTSYTYVHLARDTIKASAARMGDSIDGDLEAAEHSTHESRDSGRLLRPTTICSSGPQRPTRTRPTWLASKMTCRARSASQ